MEIGIKGPGDEAMLDGTSRLSRGWKNMAHGRHSGYLKLVQICTIA